LRSRRQRIEHAALVSGAPQDKTCPHAGRKNIEEDQENLVVWPPGVAGISK
jgi:hypothetical protein